MTIGTASEPEGAAPLQSESDARREVEAWMDWLVESGQHRWVRTSQMGLQCQPTPELPCRILAATSYVEDRGHLPYLMLMAGRKRSNRYWQYTTQDLETGVPHPREKSLSDITGLVDTLARVADVPHRYPTRRIARTSS
jgi:hypothetical protein